MASTYLSRTPSSSSNRRTWTWSAWVKRSNLSTGNQVLFQAIDGGFPEKIQFTSSDRIEYDHDIAGTDYTIYSERRFRDTNGWYHIVVAKDTTQATETDRIKIYVNNEQVAMTEEALGYPGQNYEGAINKNVTHNLGANNSGSSEVFSGCMSHVHFVDGSALAPTVFGSTDSTTGEWKINTSPSVTYGTNGFFILKDGNSVTDQSGNSNNFTVAGGTLTKTLDCPSNNFATLNPNDVMKQSSGILKPTYSNGNLTMANGVDDNRQAFATISPETGKWYWEMKIDAAVTTGHRIGVFFGNNKTHSGSYYYGADAFYIHQNGEIYYNGSSVAYCASYTAGDIISVALDVTNGNIYISKNGGASDSTWSDGNGNNNQAFPGTSINGKLSASWISGPVTPFFDVYGNGNKQSINFGNGFFGTTAITTNSGNGYAGADGKSKFNYQPPTGYSALSTKGLNT